VRDIVIYSFRTKIANFYSKKSLREIFGSDDFVKKIKSKIEIVREIYETTRIQRPFTIKQVIDKVSEHYSINPMIIIRKRRDQKLKARSVAIHLCKKITLSKLNEIAKQFNFKNDHGLSSTLASIERQLKQDKQFQDEINLICKKFVL